ncbi:diguanylate cyclase [Caballeronia sp. RCC_10]|jgi:diguanylate cyclase (GGDEF)-like protein|uniref:sensor domain-containing diguanylate cyclase n=1 Tax=Caballeronia sp. RCC_10 TaxID=3239227 RepID=UPI003525282A
MKHLESLYRRRDALPAPNLSSRTALAVGRVLNVFALRPYVAALVGTSFALVVFALLAVTLHQGRQEVIGRAQDNSRNVAAIVSSDIGRHIELYDLSLQAAVDGAKQPRIMQLAPDIRDRVLFDRAASGANVEGMAVTGADGRIIASQGVNAVTADYFRSRENFLAHQRPTTSQVFMSHPYADSREWTTIGVSRRIDALDGRFAGMAILEIRATYFQQLVDQVEVGSHGSAFITRTDGTLIARRPVTSREVAMRIARSRTFHTMVDNQTGSYVAHSPIDGRLRLYTFARVPGTPLIVVIAPDVEDVLASWRPRSVIVVSLSAVLSAAFVLVCWLLARGLQQKEKSRKQLLSMASVDALTSLSNRRALDVYLARAWEKAKGENHPVSAIFIDVDYFKAYNDRFGHDAGDQALRLIAVCIRAAIRNAEDIAARYGGEEFVVVLPGARIEAAARVAEAIRSGVEALALPGAGATSDKLTVSLGIAACEPQGTQDASRLLKAADDALYKAKREGRNQVRQQSIHVQPAAVLTDG